MSCIGIAIALLYNMSLANHYQRRGALIPYTIEPGYNDIGLSDTSSITPNVFWCQLIPTVDHNITLLGSNNTRL